MPYKNEHSCRLQDPKKYKSFARKNCDQKHKGKCIDVIYGIKEVKASAEVAAVLHALPWLNQRLYDAGEFAFVNGKVYQARKSNRGKRPPNADCWKLVSEVQSLRFATKIWTASEVKSICKERKGTFEAAGKSKKNQQTAMAVKYNCECIKCGYQEKSDKHCASLKCPKCGGQMRRKERPGPGQDKNTAPQTACSFGEECQICFVEDEEKDYDLEVVAYSGKIIPKHWFWGNVAFDLKGCKFDKPKTPILEEHERAIHLAYSKEQEVIDAVRLQCRFLTNTRAQEIKQDMKEGFPMQASVFILPLEIERLKTEKDKAEVNGQTINGPGSIFRKSVIREASLCTLGADKYTKSAIAAKETETKISFNVLEKEGSFEDMEMELITMEQLTEDRPDLAAELMASGVDKGMKETRELFGEFAEKFGDDPVLCIEQFKKGASIEEATAAQNEKLKASNEAMAKAAKEAAAKAAATNANANAAEQEFSDEQTETDSSHGDGSQLKGEAKWKDEFSKSEDLQGQFKTEEAYIAFKKHDEAGEVHIAGRKE